MSILPVDAPLNLGQQYPVSQIPGLRQISSQKVINRVRQAGLQARRPERHKVLTAQHLAERLVVSRTLLFDGDMQSGERFSFQMNLASSSEQMDGPESIDDIRNVMPSIEF